MALQVSYSILLLFTPGTTSKGIQRRFSPGYVLTSSASRCTSHSSHDDMRGHLQFSLAHRAPPLKPADVTGFFTGESPHSHNLQALPVPHICFGRWIIAVFFFSSRVQSTT